MSKSPAVECWLCGHDMTGIEQSAAHRNDPFRNGACACCQPILTDVINRFDHYRTAGHPGGVVTLTAVRPTQHKVAMPPMVRLTGALLVVSLALSIFSFIIRTQS